MEIMDALEDGHGKLLLGFTSLELLLLKVTDTTGDRLACSVTPQGSNSRPLVYCNGHYRGQVSMDCYSSGVVAVDPQSLVMVSTGGRLAYSVTPQG